MNIPTVNQTCRQPTVKKKPEKTHTRSAGKKTVAAVVGATDTMVAGQVDRSLSISVSCESSRGG